MEIYNDKLKQTHGYQEGRADAVDGATMTKALGYKKDFLKRFISIGPQQIESRMGGNNYYVTRKYDGEYAVIVHEHGDTVIINRSGRVRMGIPCVMEAGAMIESAGYTQAVIPAEIYLPSGKNGVRARVNDLVSALADKSRVTELRLAAFDILELDGLPYRPLTYQDTYDTLSRIFPPGGKCHPVDMRTAFSSAQIQHIYTVWVEQENSEGLVVRSDLPFVYKIKPRHTLDMVVVGYTEGTGDQKGQVRTLLLAMVAGQGRYQVVGRTGGGFGESLRRDLFVRFSNITVESDYIESDSNHVAFRMVEPETVIEITVNDIVYETSSGPLSNPLLDYRDGRYIPYNIVDGVSLIAPIFNRMRPDKLADADDAGIGQIDDPRLVADQKSVSAPKEPVNSTMILRDVYRKTLGPKVMLQKYLIWKTNKEESGLYPAYVLFYTNFSTGRQVPLQREIRVSDDLEQIDQLYQKYLDQNIKQGWQRVSITGDIKQTTAEDALE